MTGNEVEVSEIPKRKSKKRKRKTPSLVSILFCLVLLGVGLYLNYMNYAPFQGSKVAGVPDGSIKLLDDQPEILSLVFNESYGGYAFNTEGKEINVYLAVYERDVRTKHELVAGLKHTEKTAMNGTLHWGVASDVETRQTQEIRVNILSNGARVEGAHDFTKLSLADSGGAGFAAEVVSREKIEKGRPYILQAWFSDGVISANNDFFNEDILKNNAQTAILYVVFTS